MRRKNMSKQKIARRKSVIQILETILKNGYRNWNIKKDGPKPESNVICPITTEDRERINQQITHLKTLV